jgi:hypothetical protein
MKRAIAVVAGTILIGLMLSGCVTTQSGPPEVTFNTTDTGKIKSAIINDLKKLDFKVVSDTYDNFILEGRRLGETGTDTMHAIFSMGTTGDSTSVVYQAYLKADASFGRNTYVEDITYGNTGAALLKILKNVKAQVESE